MSNRPLQIPERRESESRMSPRTPRLNDGVSYRGRIYRIKYLTSVGRGAEYKS